MAKPTPTPEERLRAAEILLGAELTDLSIENAVKNLQALIATTQGLPRTTSLQMDASLAYLEIMARKGATENEESNAEEAVGSH